MVALPKPVHLQNPFALPTVVSIDVAPRFTAPTTRPTEHCEKCSAARSGTCPVCTNARVDETHFIDNGTEPAVLLVFVANVSPE